MRARAIAGSALLIGGMAAIVLAGGVMRHSAGPCLDIGFGAHLFARTSIGPQLPLPLLQSCTRGGLLAGALYAGFATAFLGMLLVLQARVSRTLLVALTAAAISAAMLVPFVPNIDPYAYAFYAYESFVLRLSPYAAHHLIAADAAGRTFALLFPEGANPLRVSTYGPLFSGIYALLIGPLFTVSLGTALLGERLLGAAALLALAALLSSIAAGPGRRQKIFAAIALNPLLLLESVSFAHGDVIMLALLAAALVLYRKQRFAWAAVCCVLAVETRSIAILALIVLFVELLRRRAYRPCAFAAGAAMLALAITAAASFYAFGAFRLAGPFLYADRGAPGTVLSALLGGSGLAALKAGLLLDACIGACAVYFAIRNRLYALVPLGAMLALPAVEPQYAQWLAPFAALTSNRPYRIALVGFMLAAPLQMVLDMTSHADDPILRSCVVAVLWGVPAIAYGLASAELRGRRSLKPIPEVQ